MVSGAYAAEYGQREDIDEAMKKVQVRRREANNWVQKSEATAYQDHVGTSFLLQRKSYIIVHSYCIPELASQQGITVDSVQHHSQAPPLIFGGTESGNEALSSV